MTDHDPREPQRPEREGVRIVSAEELAQRDADAPPVVNVGPATGELELPHWTEPATGQVPKVVLGDEGDEAERALPGFDAPQLLTEHDTRSHTDLLADLAAIEPEEAVVERLGALDTEERISDEEYLNFDDVELDPRRRARRQRRKQASGPDPFAAILPPDLVGGPSPSAPPPPAVAATAANASSTSNASSDEDPAAPRRRPRPVEQPAKPGGRDVRLASIVGAAMVVVALIAFKIGPTAAMVLIEVVIAAAGVEFYGAVQRAGFRPATLLGIAGVFALPLAAYWKGESAIPAIVFLVFVFGIVWYLLGVGGAGRPTANLGVTLLGLVWVGVFGSFAALLVDVPSQGVSLLLLAIVAAVAHDVGGFFLGRAVGRTPLTAVSPNKTVEGLIGGMVSTVFAIFVFAVVLGVGDLSAGKALVLGIVLAIVAPLGDLAESLFKRDLGLKDMGSLIPEHGGLLDRFDGLLLVLPATYYVVRAVGLG